MSQRTHLQSIWSVGTDLFSSLFAMKDTPYVIKLLWCIAVWIALGGLFPASTLAQTAQGLKIAPPPSLSGPDSGAQSGPSGIAASWFSASDGNSSEPDYLIEIRWEVLQICLSGGPIRVQLYKDNVQIFSYDYGNTAYQHYWTHGWNDWVGPEKSHQYRLDVQRTGFLCNEPFSMSDGGSTVALLPPTSVSATNPTRSDKFIHLSWKRTSTLTTSFSLYEGGQRFLTVPASETSYTVSTTPDNRKFWGVATSTLFFGGRTSAIAGNQASTDSFYRPESLFASLDTTIGYVRLRWTCVSDFATHFQIFRDGELYATIPASQKYYLDYSVVPGRDYYYKVRSYNTSGSASEFSGVVHGRAVYVNASDGTPSKIDVTWTNFPVDFGNVVFYRDDIQISPTPASPYADYGASLGKIHKYTIQVKNNEGIVVLTLSDYGFSPADGSVIGRVTTPTSVSVKGIEMRAYALSRNLTSALSFDGVDDYVSTPPLLLNSNTVTLSAWIKRNGTQNDWAGILFSRAQSTVAGLSILNTGELRYTWNNLAQTWEWNSGLIVPDNEWTFVALVIEPQKATIYMNDSSTVNAIPHDAEEFDGSFEMGRDIGHVSRYFKGLIDEVCVWKTARTREQLEANRRHIMRGSEEGLVAYWGCNERSGDYVGDYVTNGNHHGSARGAPAWSEDSPGVWHYAVTEDGGEYTIDRIYWENEVVFTIRPFKKDHGFRGASFPGDSTTRAFTVTSHAKTGVDFYDTTSIEISGRVYLDANPPCPLSGVKILLNGISTEEYTDSSGHFSTSVGEPRRYVVSAEYLNHTFMPASVELNILDPVTDLAFYDTTTRRLSGKVAGGCDNFLGLAEIRLQSIPAGCTDTTIRTDINGFYSIPLPAQKYASTLIHIEHPDSVIIINYFARDTVDVSQHDTTHDYIYHSPPITKISDLPPSGCGIYNVPILLQESEYTVKIDVAERYGDVECSVTTGSVHLFDRVSYTARDTNMTLEHGRASYPFSPGYPNITGGGPHPYQKMLVVETHSDRYTRLDTVWIFVRGQKPQEFEFSTVSPEIPLMILRDPPGDRSYSYLSRTTTSSVNIGFSFETEVGAGVYANFKSGFGVNHPVIGPIGAWGAGQVEASAGIRNSLQGTQEIRLSATDILRTSDLDVITGAKGDVYLGAAINIIYAKTDVIDYDSVTCSVVRDTGIVWDGNGFKTTYIYTESHIRESVIPGLQHLADILSGSSDTRKQDSAKILLNQITVWQQILDYNSGLKQTAVPIPGFPTNISFSSGANREYSATIASTSTLSVAMNLFIDASVAQSCGAKLGDFNEVELGYKIYAKLNVGVSASASLELSNTIGFQLADDDVSPPGDAFTLDVLGDPAYCTPVFKLLSGTSSCPWEHPTKPREGVGLAMNTYVLNNVPPDMPAQFDLYLYNLTQNDETRGYLLSLVQGSNPDGAIISVGGAVLGDDELLFSMEPNRDHPQRATLRVAREAGSVYDYDNLMLHLYSPCDPQFDTTVAFSVHFIKPCSDVRIVQPPMNWILNQSCGHQMTIVLKDYDPANNDMQELKFQYRLRGANDWTELFNYPRSLLPGDSIRYVWDVSGLAEGSYELTASTHCSMGSYSTRIHAGMYDCRPPETFGTPQPADGCLDSGDDIMIAFGEGINCATVSREHVKMWNISRALEVPVNVVCGGDRIAITPVSLTYLVEGDSMRVVVDSLSDPYGNAITQPIEWRFIIGKVTGSIVDRNNGIPKEFVLEQNYPNPFNPSMKIRIAIPTTAFVLLTVYDVTGREITQVVNQTMSPGYYEVPFDGRNLTSGVYFYYMRAGNFQAVKKMLLMK